MRRWSQEDRKWGCSCRVSWDLRLGNWTTGTKHSPQQEEKDWSVPSQRKKYIRITTLKEWSGCHRRTPELEPSSEV
ncbi:rCG21290 [Rattus norvegicus]|uniref:RCG21290 n=1 Tax=Rattus norvegicus TaxID=10116 RepID=A6J0M0_RAT|nr:rCG21290 [Rattus norvegicus]